MTSAAKVRANQANARASTGPKTAAGRQRSAQNALRHGLNLPVETDPALAEEIDALALEIAGLHADAEMKELTRRVAEAQIDLRRVCFARHRLLSDRLDDPYYESPAATWKRLRVLRHMISDNPPDIPIETVEKALNPTPKGPQKFATILLQEIRQLRALDRYERRALARRKFAIRALDDARQRFIDNWQSGK